VSLLKKSFIKDIYDAVAGSCFTVADFQFEFPDTGPSLLKIFFRYKPSFRFILNEKNENETDNNHERHVALPATCEVKNGRVIAYLLESPGEYKAADEQPICAMEDIPKKIPQWCSNIHKELATEIDTHDDFDEFREELEELIRKHIAEESVRFTPDEVEKLSDKLDNLYKTFEELQKQNKLTGAELKDVKQQLNALMSSAKAYSKGLWARVANNRLLKIMSDVAQTEEEREVIAESIKKMHK